MAHENLPIPFYQIPTYPMLIDLFDFVILTIGYIKVGIEWNGRLCIMAFRKME